MRIFGMHGAHTECAGREARARSSGTHAAAQPGTRQPARLDPAQGASHLETPAGAPACALRAPLRFAARREGGTARRQRATRASARRQHSIARSAQKALRVGLSALLACLLAFTLSSCRESDALTEKIIGAPYEYETDYSLTPTAFDNPEAAQTDRTSQRETEEAQREDTWEENQPQYSSEDTTTTEETRTTVETQTLSSDLEASEGSTQTDEGDESITGGSLTGGTQSSGDQDDSSSAAGGDEETSRGQTIVVNSSSSSTSQEEDNDSDIENDEQEDQDESWDPGTGSSGTGGGSSTTGGTYVEGDITSGNLPYVNSIAAAGPYATIVQALGGAGALAACDADWYNSLADEAFSYKSELSDTTVISAWDGGASMNEATFQAIVDSGAEAVITSASYGDIDQDWAERFNEAGIDVIELPVLGVTDVMDSDIETCVVAIGALLARAGSNIAYDADAMADLWVELHDAALDNTVDANGGYTTYLMDGYSWDILFDGVGGFASVNATHITRSSSNRFYTTVVDSWTESSESLITDTGTVSSYPYDRAFNVWPYAGENSWNTLSISQTGAIGEFLPYVLDVSDGFAKAVTSSGIGGNKNFVLSDYYLQHAGIIDTLASYHSQAYTSAGIDRTSTSIFLLLGRGKLWIYQSTLHKDPVVVGDDSYPGLIIRNDETIINSIQASAQKAEKAETITVYQSIGTIGTYNFGQTYYLYVVPDGADGMSWLDGTFESFLMAPWAYCCFQQSGDLSACTSYLNYFYETFYRCGSDVAGENGYGRIVEVQCNLG